MNFSFNPVMMTTGGTSDDGDKRHLKLLYDVEKYVKFFLCIYNSGKSHFQKNLNKILVK